MQSHVKLRTTSYKAIHFTKCHRGRDYRGELFYNMQFYPFVVFLSHILGAQCTDHEVDVAIIGRGLSGLSAAKDLAAVNKSFAILEAQNRVGDCVLNANFPGKGVEELGAEYVGPTQDRVLALAAELGLQTLKSYTTGNSSFFRNGTVRHYRDVWGSIPPVDIGSLIEHAVFMNDINTLANTVDRTEPGNTPNTTMLDSLTLEAFVKSRLFTALSRMLLNVVSPAILSAELRELSLLYALWGISGAGNATLPGTINRIFAVDGGAQDSRVNGGTQLLVVKLSEKIESKNIFINAPVRNVKLEKARYTLTSDSLTVSARHVVVAMSPPLAAVSCLILRCLQDEIIKSTHAHGRYWKSNCHFPESMVA